MGEPQKHYANWKPDTKDHTLHDSVYMKYWEKVNPKRKQIHGCQGLDGRGRDGEWLLNGYRFFFWDGENVLELDRGHGCVTMWMYDITCSF